MSSRPNSPTPASPSPSDYPEWIPNQTPRPNQAQTSLTGPIAILWDIENCPVPSDVRPEDVAGNIRMALRVHPVIQGAVTLFSAYGDFNSFPRRLREGCQRTGVKLIDVPNGRKDAADKAILIDMFLFALDSPPPSSIVLISGDVDFAPALHILGQRGYTVVVVIPSKIGVSSALCSAGRFVWDWLSVARGEGLLPPVRSSRRPVPCFPGPREISELLAGARISDETTEEEEEESIVYKGMHSQSLSECSGNADSNNRSGSCGGPLGLDEARRDSHGLCEESDVAWVQPGDLNGLKGQIVRLLEMSGGFLPLVRLASEYQRNYGRPLYVSEYGAAKLVILLKKMDDVVSVEGKGQKRVVCLHGPEAGPASRKVVLARREQKGKSDVSRAIESNLENFRYELQEILVSYSCRVFVGYFEEIYHQRYKRQLNYASFGVSQLEELLEKVNNVAVLQEDPASKRKFLVAVGR